MNLDPRRAWLVDPEGLGRPGAGDLAPLPSLPPVAYPKKLVSHDLFVGADVTWSTPLSDLVRDLNERLIAEAARLRRLLPDPPDGYEWRAELNIETRIEYPSATDVARVRYRLVRVDSAS